jgi:Fic family protein
MIDLESIKRRNEQRKRWEETDELLLPAPLTAFEEAIRDIDALVAEVERLRATQEEMNLARKDHDEAYGDAQRLSSAPGMHLGPKALHILELMRRQPETFCTAADLCKHLDCTANEVRVALAQLERLGFVDRGHTADGTEEFVINRTAPPR